MVYIQFNGFQAQGFSILRPARTVREPGIQQQDTLIRKGEFLHGGTDRFRLLEQEVLPGIGGFLRLIQQAVAQFNPGLYLLRIPS